MARLGVAVGAGLVASYFSRRARRMVDDGLVDWPAVERIASSRLRRLPGTLTARELQASERSYAEAMARIVPVLEVRLGRELPGVVERHAVVDRAGWARANLVTFRTLIERMEHQLELPRRTGTLSSGVAAVANRFLTTQQIGFLLGYLGGRVLGQYDVALLSAEQAPGRLLYVEENVRTTARQLGIPLEDFRVWIALHETTHAFELEAHPWLRPYLKERLERQLTLFLDDAKDVQRHGLGPLVRRWRSAASEGGLSGLLSPEQRGLLRETQLVMSLMEGFSDWVMDEVGASMIRDVPSIRARFDARRAQRRRGLDKVIARLTGLDMKMEQYRRGERFVSGVARAGGEPAIRRLWDGPHALPTDREFDDPAAWVRRMVPDASRGALPA
ncbi:zinc-dependent metalloprotease [soil metagenome]